MKTVLINASPKRRFSASSYFLSLQRLSVRGTVVSVKLRNKSDYKRILDELPDAEILVRIAEFFEVSVSELLGEKMDEKPDVNEIAVQLALLNEQLANRSRRNQKILKVVLKVVMICIAVVIALGIMMCVLGVVRSYEAVSPESETTTVNLVCTLDGEEYYYSITYDGLYNVVEAGGDEWIYDHVNLSEYDFDASVMIGQIESYFEDRGGEVEISDEM